MKEGRAQSKAAIGELIDRYVNAVNAKDIDGVMAVYAPDVIAFDVVPPLQYVGAEAFRKAWQEVFERYQVIQYEVRHLNIIAGDDVAFSYSLNRNSGILNNAQKVDFWLRWTACYRKADDKWRIAHLQISVPADLAHGKAVLDLKP